ncbi:MAG: GNAT family N-acetyltransferase [Defluviitaleaceae bacterium]|nr:GNAT family N-acetyltransferase [Defluviitaleaceae bacterium]
MNISLCKLSPDDGNDIYTMLQALPKDENGFINNCAGMTFDEYKDWLIKSNSMSQGIGLEDWRVPQDCYWLYVDGIPVGMGKLRHRLTDALRKDGGHIGYTIHPAHRQKGYGTLLLKLLVKQACTLGIGKVLVTINNKNMPSIKVAIANGGDVEKVDDIRHFIWIST